MVTNRMVKIVALFVALTSVFSFSQESGSKYGIRAGFNLYNYSSGNKGTDKYIDMGNGFGVGLATNIPISAKLSFAPEVNFLYRKPFIYSFNEEDYSYEAWLTEFAISIPAMLKFLPSDGGTFYLAAGVQFDIPFSSETTGKVSGIKITAKTEERNSIDFGIPLGIGYLVTPNIGIDLRAVIGITSPSNDDADDYWDSYGLGLSYFF